MATLLEDKRIWIDEEFFPDGNSLFTSLLTVIIAKQIDYLGGMPKVTPKPVKTSEKAEDMLRFDLENENVPIRNYRLRVRQCEALGEYALAEHIRDILVQEQDHQIALATALGMAIPNVSQADE